MPLGLHTARMNARPDVCLPRVAQQTTTCDIAGMKLRIRELREQRGLTQEALAELVETSKGYVSQMESGKRTPSGAMLEKLAAAFGCRVPDLYDAGDVSDAISEIIAIISMVPQDERRNAGIPRETALLSAIKNASRISGDMRASIAYSSASSLSVIDSPTLPRFTSCG